MAAFVACLFAGASEAANLTLGASAAPGSPLVLTPVDFASAMVIGITNDVAADPPAEFLTAWQLRLEIQPDAGAVGTLEFASAGEADDYVFDGTGHFGPSSANSGDRLFALDFNFPSTGGVQVPAAPGVGLLSVTFAPSANALGTFGVYALAGLTNSEWSDAATPVRHRRTFANVPDAGGAVRIADVLITSAADYNRNGVVDAADYTVWRNTLGQSGAGLAADGDGNEMVDADDYTFWKSRYGTAAGPGVGSGAEIPEPASIVLLSVALTFAAASIPLRTREA